MRLSPKQLKALPHIVAAASDKEGCEAAGISRNTFYKWLREPEFAVELTTRRNQVVNEALDIIKGHTGVAVKALVELLKTDNEPLKRQVANDILSHVLRVRETEDIEQRLDAIEKAIKR